jgi:hypothetical protein
LGHIGGGPPQSGSGTAGRFNLYLFFVVPTIERIGDFPMTRVTISFRGSGAMTKTIRSQFVHEVGEMVEGFVILEKRTVIPPVPLERRRGVYDYLVEVPPIPMKADSVRKTVPERGSFTRSTPEQRSGVVRRVPSR